VDETGEGGMMRHDLKAVRDYINRTSSIQDVADQRRYVYVLVQAMTGVSIACTNNGWSQQRREHWEKWWSKISTEEHNRIYP
jgi:hypothetical protein